MAQRRSSFLSSVSISQALVWMLVILQCAFLIQAQSPSIKDILLGKADLPAPGSSASNDLFSPQPKQQSPDKTEQIFRDFMRRVKAATGGQGSREVARIRPNMTADELAEQRAKTAQAMARNLVSNRMVKIHPLPEKPDCYFDVPVMVQKTEKVRGTCHLAENGVRVCMSGDNMEFTDDCN